MQVHFPSLFTLKKQVDRSANQSCSDTLYINLICFHIHHLKGLALRFGLEYQFLTGDRMTERQPGGIQAELHVFFLCLLILRIVFGISVQTEAPGSKLYPDLVVTSGMENHQHPGIDAVFELNLIDEFVVASAWRAPSVPAGTTLVVLVFPSRSSSSSKVPNSSDNAPQTIA